MPYSKLHNVAVLIAYDVKFISDDRQKLDLSKYIYTYGAVNIIFVEIQSDSTNKNDPHIFQPDPAGNRTKVAGSREKTHYRVGVKADFDRMAVEVCYIHIPCFKKFRPGICLEPRCNSGTFPS